MSHRSHGISRRSLLTGAALAAGLTVREVAHARQMQTYLPPGVPPAVKGRRVFLDYDQTELDAAYNQALWAPNQQEVARRNAQKTAAAFSRLGPPRRFAYGPSEIEKLDVFVASPPNAPIHIHIHGGAWRGPVPASLELSDLSRGARHAEVVVDRGAHYVFPHFTNADANGGDLREMAEQVRRAIAWVYRNAVSFGGNQNRIYLSGHSSGAHLAALAMVTDWPGAFGLPADVIKGGLCISGIYELYPVSLSSRNAYVKFTPDVTQILSPQRHLANLATPVIVAYGTLESPEFQRQNREFAGALRRMGKPAALLVAEGCNHFEIEETLGNPYGLLGRAVLEQMEL
jgi:arylformamidase